MNLARKLRIAPDCPQREGEPIKRLVTGDGKFFVFGHDGYGCKPIEPMPHNPTADEITIRARAQSLMSKGGVRAELPDITTARRVVAEHQQEKAS